MVNTSEMKQPKIVIVLWLWKSITLADFQVEKLTFARLCIYVYIYKSQRIYRLQMNAVYAFGNAAAIFINTQNAPRTNIRSKLTVAFSVQWKKKN